MASKASTNMIEGTSESAWKSMAIKAIRMGWPEGLRQCAERIGKSTTKSLLLVQVFEDIFPAVSDLPDVLRQVRDLDYVSLCRWDTHCGRGLSDAFCDLAEEACEAAQKERKWIWDKGKEYGVWLPPRALNTFYTWVSILPQESGKFRSLDERPWSGVLLAAVDGHCAEGRRLGRKDLMLSGAYHRLRQLGVLVREHGWEHVRQLAHAEGVYHPPGARRVPRQGVLL